MKHLFPTYLVPRNDLCASASNVDDSDNIESTSLSAVDASNLDEGNDVVRLNMNDVQCLQTTYDSLISNQQTADTVDLTSLVRLQQALGDVKRTLSVTSRTAKLWLIYCGLCKNFKNFHFGRKIW